jgi:hypothetical protein
MTTKPSFRAEFMAGEGEETAVYMARWVNMRGEKGPWSEVATATVAAWAFMDVGGLDGLFRGLAWSVFDILEGIG